MFEITDNQNKIFPVDFGTLSKITGKCMQAGEICRLTFQVSLAFLIPMEWNNANKSIKNFQ
jgi:hypothetical protein